MAADNWNQQLQELRRLDQLHAFKMICSWCIASYALHGLISNCIFMYGSGLSGWFIWHMVWSAHHQPLTHRVCHSRLSSLSNKSHPLPLAVAENSLAWQRARLRLEVAVAGMAPGGLAWLLGDRDQRHIPKLLQSQELLPLWDFFGSQEAAPGPSCVRNRCGWAPVQRPGNLASSAVGDTESLTLSLSLWTCFHPLLLLHN